MAAEYAHADRDVVRMAGELIDDYHTHLQAANIKYLYRLDDSFYKGHRLIVKAKKCNPIEKHFYGADLLLVIDATYWNGATPVKKRAALDYGLAHFQGETKKKKDTDGEGNPIEWDEWKWSIAPYDVCEYAEVFARRGAWRGGLVYFFEGGIRELQDALRDREDMEPEDFVEELVRCAQVLCGIANPPPPEEEEDED